MVECMYVCNEKVTPSNVEDDDIYIMVECIKQQQPPSPISCYCCIALALREPFIFYITSSIIL